jgi:hypothetical protein
MTLKSSILKENKIVVDALNRRAHEVHISYISMFNTYLKDRILEDTNSYQKYVKIKIKNITGRNFTT